MSVDHVAIVREGFEAYARGELARTLARIAPDIVTYRAPPHPDAGTWRGPDGFMQAFAGWIEGFDEFSLTLEEVRAVNDRQVIARTHQRAVGAESRVPVEADFWMLYTFEEGLIARIEFHTSEAAALEASERPRARGG